MIKKISAVSLLAMGNWKNIERDISRWLSSFETDQLRFRNSFQSIVGFPSDGFRSDGMLSNEKVLLAIEIESKQTNPDTNVGKYWLLSDFKRYEKIILFHVYTPNFDSYGWRKKLAEFYADKMKKEFPIEYVLLDFRKRKETEYQKVLKDIKTKIKRYIRSL